MKRSGEEPLKPSSPSDTPPTLPALDRLVKRAQYALLWEKIWPPLALSGVCILAFLTLGWFGFWEILPALGRIIGVTLFGLAALSCLLPLARVQWPTRAQALSRIDRMSGQSHHPATALDDHLPPTSTDPVTRNLWQIHRSRLLAAAQKLVVGYPQPDLPRHDHYAVRAAILLLAGTAFIMAGHDRQPRIMAAFQWEGWRETPVPARLDAWITPPAYTRKPPVFLTRDALTAHHFTVPEGSVVVARLSEGTLTAAFDGGVSPVKNTDPQKQSESQWVLQGDGNLSLSPPTGKTRHWSFTVTPDTPPTITLAGAPKSTARGAMQLTYSVQDDYGVAAAEISVTPVETPINTLLARPLYEPPQGKLLLPATRDRNGKAQTTLDLTSHPWAGAHVEITPIVFDDKGQEGRGKSVEMLLPQRRFNDPTARALVDLRRMLALDIAARPRVETGLDALTLFADELKIPSSVYLGLRSAYWRLINAKDDAGLRDTADYLWEMALQIEDGDMPNAERDLRAAQQALKEALERGASDEEIKQLTQQLREAMNKFLTEMARQAARNPQNNQPLSPDVKVLTPQDLEKMLNQLEDLARSGAQGAAQELLSQLQDMLDNLAQSSQQGQQGQGQNEAMEQLNKNIQDLGKIIQDQSQLRDRTFQEEQKQRDPEQAPSDDPEQKPDLSELEKQQGALQQQLEALQKGLQGLGVEAPQGFTDAGKAMGQARGQLGEGDAGDAAQSQAQALSKLREGAKNLMDQLASRSSGGQQQGQQGQGGMPRSGQARGEGVDPLGRPTRSQRYDAGDTVRVPGEIQAQRARKIMEELRRRLSDPQRPQPELDYLERLVDP